MRLHYTVELEVAENEKDFQQIESQIKQSFMNGAKEMTKMLLKNVESRWVTEHRGYRHRGYYPGKFSTSFGEFSLDRLQVRYRDEQFFIIDRFMGLKPYSRTTQEYDAIVKDKLTEMSFRKGNREIMEITGVETSAMASWKRLQQLAREEKDEKMPVLLKNDFATSAEAR